MGLDVTVPSGTLLAPPSEEELAAIAAAVEAAWPRPVVAAEDGRVPAWRFSGRPWARPIAVRRPRPWID